MEQKKSSKKDYRKQSSQFFLIGLIVSLSITLLAFEYRTPEYEFLVFPQESDEYVFPNEILVPIVLPKPPTPPKPAVAGPPVPKPNPEPVFELKPDLIILPDPVISDSAFFIPEEKPVMEDVLLLIVEKMPSFKGGERGLFQYLSKNLKYPALALDNNLEAKIHVQFVVNKDGSLSDVKVLNPSGYGFDEEALRVLKEMPSWSPGQQSGRNVRVQVVIPIIFTLL
jgi:protein TonB